MKPLNKLQVKEKYILYSFNNVCYWLVLVSVNENYLEIYHSLN